MGKKIEIVVAESTFGVASGIRQFLKDTKAALADGWQPGSDIPTILGAAYLDLLPVLQHLGKVKDEVAADPRAFAKAVSDQAIDIAFDLIG